MSLVAKKRLLRLSVESIYQCTCLASKEQGQMSSFQAEVFHQPTTYREKTAKGLTRLHGRAHAPELSLFAWAIMALSPDMAYILLVLIRSISLEHFYEYQ